MSAMDENWDIQINLNKIEQKSYEEFEAKVNCLNQHILELIENCFQTRNRDDGGSEMPYNSLGKTVPSNDDDLKSLLERNKQLRIDIENKVESLSKQKVQYEIYKKDQKLLSQEIKETHEAFLMAKKHYKKFLKIYYTIESRNDESQTIFLQFFTEAKRESENYSIRLLRDTKTGSYKLIGATPKLKMFKDLQEHLHESNDILGALCSVRQAFMYMKKNK